MLRLNLSIPPSKTPNILGVVGGDVAGFPNGRRLGDDVVAIELRVRAPMLDFAFFRSRTSAGSVRSNDCWVFFGCTTSTTSFRSRVSLDIFSRFSIRSWRIQNPRMKKAAIATAMQTARMTSVRLATFGRSLGISSPDFMII